MTERNTLDQRILFTFNKRGGKVVRSAEGMGRGMLGMYALQNTSKGRVSILVFADDHMIERVYIGDEGCPEVIYAEKAENGLGCLDEYIKDEQHIYIDQLLKFVEKYSKNA